MELFSRHPRGDSKITDLGVRIEGEFVSIIRDYLKTIEDDGALGLVDNFKVFRFRCNSPRDCDEALLGRTFRYRG
jgi:hypothetical protein